MRTSKSSNQTLDWGLASFFLLVQTFLLWPLHNRGIQLFDEATQLRFAQQAIGEPTGPLLPHGFPGFDFLYGLWFRIFPLTLENLRLEVFLLMTASLGVFVLLARLLLSRREVLAITLPYLIWQLTFATFAYYSREANFSVLLAVFFLALWISRKRLKFLLASGVMFAWAILFKFNVGLAGAAAAFFFLCYEDRKGRSAGIWVLSLMVTLLFFDGLSHLFHRPTDLWGVMLHMPVSYAKTLHTPIPSAYFLLFLTAIMPLRQWLQDQDYRKSTQGRLSLLFILWLPFALSQDFPRHWIAHVLWVPLPFWILAALSHRLLWRKSFWNLFSGCCLVMFLCAYGLWVIRPWKMITQQRERLMIARAENIAVSPVEARVIRKVVSEIKAHARPQEPIFIFPAQPLFYFLSERINATSFDNFHGGKRWEDQAIAQLQQNPVPILVTIPGKGVWNLNGQEEAPKLLNWIESNYRVSQLIDEPGYFPFCLLSGDKNPQKEP